MIVVLKRRFYKSSLFIAPEGRREDAHTNTRAKERVTGVPDLFLLFSCSEYILELNRRGGGGEEVLGELGEVPNSKTEGRNPPRFQVPPWIE